MLDIYLAGVILYSAAERLDKEYFHPENYSYKSWLEYYQKESNATKEEIDGLRRSVLPYKVKVPHQTICIAKSIDAKGSKGDYTDFIYYNFRAYKLEGFSRVSKKSRTEYLCGGRVVNGRVVGRGYSAKDIVSATNKAKYDIANFAGESILNTLKKFGVEEDSPSAKILTNSAISDLANDLTYSMNIIFKTTLNYKLKTSYNEYNYSKEYFISFDSVYISDKGKDDFYVNFIFPLYRLGYYLRKNNLLYKERDSDSKHLETISFYDKDNAQAKWGIQTKDPEFIQLIQEEPMLLDWLDYVGYTQVIGLETDDFVTISTASLKRSIALNNSRWVKILPIEQTDAFIENYKNELILSIEREVQQ